MELNYSNYIFTTEEKSNKIRTKLLLITDSDNRELKKTQQNMLINSSAPSKHRREPGRPARRRPARRTAPARG